MTQPDLVWSDQKMTLFVGCFQQNPKASKNAVSIHIMNVGMMSQATILCCALIKSHTGNRISNRHHLQAKTP